MKGTVAMPIGKLATQDAVTASKDANLKEIAEQMKSEMVGSVIITEDDKPVGIVTDRDIAFAAAEGNDVESTTAEEIMSEDVQTIDSDIEGYEAIEQMSDAEVRRFPVVDENGELVGIVTLDDVVATVGRELEQIADIIEKQSPEYSPA